jgi:drug/metabolite transporter (DMT)-like permease
MLIAILTLVTLVAFAANSRLCRMALGDNHIDPVSFTTVRIASGALILIPLARFTTESATDSKRQGSWGSGLALFFYAGALSLAYISLDTGMGALILFGSVQATMIGAGIVSGEQPRAIQWIGIVTALGGLAYVVWPGMSAPDLKGAILMLLSGIAWGAYSLRGKGVSAPIATTAGNFVRAVPMAVCGSIIAFATIHYENIGIVLALVSGTITSALGYVLWYRVLRNLSTTQAAIVQLLVPVIAAFGGVAFLTEQVTTRLIISSVLILGGVAVTVLHPP